MEIADLVVVNKFDSEYERSCRLLRNQLESAMSLTTQKVDGWEVPVILASAKRNFGIHRIYEIAREF